MESRLWAMYSKRNNALGPALCSLSRNRLVYFESYLPLNVDEREACRRKKERCLELFAPEHIETCEEFNPPLLPKEIKLYWIQNVQFIP
jgi:hypothetical protein